MIVRDSLQDDLVLVRTLRVFQLIGPTGLFETGKLYMPTLGDQHDKLEGLHTQGAFDAWEATEEEAGNPEWLLPMLMATTTHLSKNCTFVSCWCEDEEAALENANSYDGVASIITSVGRLRNAIEDSQNLYLGRVNYVSEDYEPSENDLIELAFTKRSSFQWEREIRIIDFRGPNGGNLADELTKVPDHIELPLSLSDLIERIVILSGATDEQRKEIIEHCERLGVAYVLQGGVN